MFPALSPPKFEHSIAQNEMKQFCADGTLMSVSQLTRAARSKIFETVLAEMQNNFFSVPPFNNDIRVCQPNMLTKSLEDKYKREEPTAKWDKISGTFGELSAERNYGEVILAYGTLENPTYKHPDEGWSNFEKLLFVERVPAMVGVDDVKFVEILIVLCATATATKASGTSVHIHEPT